MIRAIAIDEKLIRQSNELVLSIKIIRKIPKLHEISKIEESLGLDNPLEYGMKMYRSLNNIISKCNHFMETLELLDLEISYYPNYNEVDYDNVHSIVSDIRRESISLRSYLGTELNALMKSKNTSPFTFDEECNMIYMERKRCIVNDMTLQLVHACSKITNYGVNHTYFNSLFNMLKSYGKISGKSIDEVSIRRHEVMFQ
jgi:hypothetical protein